MKPELLKRIEQAVRECHIRVKKPRFKGYWLWKPMPAKIRKRIMRHVRRDTILTELGLRVNTRIRCDFDVDNGAIELEIGIRDYTFSRTGSFQGSGCWIDFSANSATFRRD